MAYNSPADNYVRAFTAAFTIVAGQDTTDDSVKDVAATVSALAEKLWKQQNKFVKDNDLQESSRQTSSGKSSGDSGGSGSASSGLTPKQRNAVQKALKSLGDDAPYSQDDIETAEGKERSEMIGELFDAAWGDN